MTDTSAEAVERHVFRIDPHGYSQPRSLNDDTIALLRALAAENERLKAVLTSPLAELLPDVTAAAEKAMRKFPQPNYVISKWAEETGEVTKALIHAAEDRETWENLRGEIVQSLAMLHRLFVEGDQVHGLQPLAALKGSNA